MIGLDRRLAPAHLARFLLYRLVIPTLHRGRRYECPCCGRTFRSFRDYRARSNVRCPACGSLERHRLVWLYVVRRTDLVSGRQRSLLHIAPEVALGRLFAALDGLRYVGGDLDSARAPMQLDVRDLPFADGSFEYVICSHVLDYVAEDARAMREIARVLAPGGRAIVLVALDRERRETDDGAIVDVPEKHKFPGEGNPVRIYGADFAARLRAAGLDVEELGADDLVSAADADRYRLDRLETLFICRRARSGSPQLSP